MSNYDRYLDACCARWEREDTAEPDVLVCQKCGGEGWVHTSATDDDAIAECDKCEGRGCVPSKAAEARERRESIRDDEYMDRVREPKE